MRWFDYVLIGASCVMAMIVAISVVMMLTQPNTTNQKKNAYWPYSVETSIKDI